METLFVLSLVFLISAVILYGAMAIWRAAKLSVKAYRNIGLAQSDSQRLSATLLALNMIEPAVVACAFLVVVIANIVTNDFLEVLFFLFGLHMALLLLPLLGLFAVDQRLRRFNGNLLISALPRIATTLIIGLPFATGHGELAIMSAPFGVIGGTIYLWFQVNWMRQQLLMLRNWFLQPLPSAVPTSKSAAMPAARPVGVALRVAHVPTPVRHAGPPIFCPLCHATTSLTDEACPSCGLFFRSRIPPALFNLRRYRPLRPLGDGGMSSVYLARDLAEGKLRVLKTLASVDGGGQPGWRAAAQACLEREAQLLARLEHARIVRQVAYEPDGALPYLVLDYVAGPTLEQRLSRIDQHGNPVAGRALPPGEALRYAASVAELLVYLSSLSQPVLHLDIKPANLIVPPAQREPVLVDFGSARSLTTKHEPGARITASLDNFGTPGYAAPEQYRGQPTLSSDIYGLGATLYHLLTDDDPSAQPLQFPALAKLPPDIAALLRAMLAPEPAARPAAAELRAELPGLARKYG